MANEISIIVPMYNERKRIEDTMNKLADYLILHPEDEVIFVDDGSKDGTVSTVFKNRQDPKRMRMVCLMPNQGKWAAIRAGFLKAKKDYVAILDADLSIGPDQVNKYRDLLEEKKVLIGDRYSGTSKVPFKRLIPSRVFNWFVRNMFNMKFKDTQAPMKIFVRDTLTMQIFEDLSERRFAGDVEVLAFLKLFNYKIKSVPVDYNFAEGSTLNVRKHSGEMLRGLFRIRRKWLKKRR